MRQAIPLHKDSTNPAASKLSGRHICMTQCKQPEFVQVKSILLDHFQFLVPESRKRVKHTEISTLPTQINHGGGGGGGRAGGMSPQQIPVHC